MAEYIIQDTSLKNIADAIRAKTGDTDQMTPAQMATEIGNIETGITPAGTKQVSVSQNGTVLEDVYDYANVNISVAVPQPSGTKNISISQNGTTTENVNDYSSAEITVNVPNTYVAGDEGKVVHNGGLVSQTAHAKVVQNGTIDTTRNNSVQVAVPASAVDTGTKAISANGTHDVVGYASASVNVPNSYSASDEGKVVSGGALVNQTAHSTVTSNGTIDTTLNNSVTVNVPEKVSESWHQDSEAVRNYIAEVDYTNVAYTESDIGDYAPTPAVPATNTKPIGKTVDGVTFYNEEPGKKTPFATTNKAGTVEPLDQVRWIKSTTSNMRDLGGWSCDGGTVRYGLLYRSGELSAQDESLFIDELGINTECDLTADGVPAFPGRMRFIGHTSYAMYSLSNTGAWLTNLRGIIGAVVYRDPVVFHCSMGADRTGTLACVLEGLLGVSQSDCDKDYELTSFYSERARNKNYQGGTTDWAHLIGQINALSGSTFRDKCVTFALSVGITIDEINAYRTAMIDGTPEVLHAPTVNITNSLTNCSTNNLATTIEESKSYSATITADSGYTLEGATVSVTMGGVDITATAYDEGVISIPYVSGAIVITISAEAEQHLKELFDLSTTTINQRFSSSGAFSAQNGNFCTDFIPVSGINTSEPWRIHIREIGNDTRFRATGAQESILFCKADKTVMNLNYGRFTVNKNTGTNNTICKYEDSNGGVYMDINKTSDGNYIPTSYFDITQVAYIRICVTYTGNITITDVNALANVSITADKITDEGGSDEPTNLFDENDADVTLGARINSSGGAVAYADGQLVTGFIPAVAGDVFRIETDKALDTNSYTGMLATYTSAKGYIWSSGHANNQAWTFDAGGLTGTATVLSDVGGHDQTGTAYVRFCVAYTDINNIKIYKQ